MHMCTSILTSTTNAHVHTLLTTTIYAHVHVSTYYLLLRMHIQAVSIPDVDPYDVAANGGEISMAAGDFLEVLHAGL